jgi:hypothetical protein
MCGPLLSSILILKIRVFDVRLMSTVPLRHIRVQRNRVGGINFEDYKIHSEDEVFIEFFLRN